MPVPGVDMQCPKCTIYSNRKQGGCVRRCILVITMLLLTQVYAGSLTEIFFQPCPRAHSVMVADTDDDRIILYGGDQQQSISPLYYSDVYELRVRPNRPRWYSVDVKGQPPSTRTYCASAYDAAGDRLIIFGGCFEYTFFNDVWELDLTTGSETWQMLSPSGTSPAPREAATSIIDPVNNRMIVFGGYDLTTSARNDVWELDLTTLAWTQLFPAGTSPSIRYAHSAIYDPVDHRMIVFGGIAPYSPGFNDVWELDLTDGAETWQQLSPTGAIPPARCRHFGVYNSVSNEMIVGFGYNYTGATILYNDVWVLDLGSCEWRDVSNGGFAITARRGASAAFYPNDEVTYIFGGHVLDNQYCMETFMLITNSTAREKNDKEKVFDNEYLKTETSPNRLPVKMNLYIPEPALITLKVVDISGRVVSTLIEQMRYSGHCIAVWEGKDNQGNKLPAGTYFGVLEMGDQVVVKKALVVK
jgi:outer membrane protein assembly factor BamB